MIKSERFRRELILVAVSADGDRRRRACRWSGARLGRIAGGNRNNYAALSQLFNKRVDLALGRRNIPIAAERHVQDPDIQTLAVLDDPFKPGLDLGVTDTPIARNFYQHKL